MNLLQFNNRYSDVFEFLYGYGPWYKYWTLFSPIDIFSIVLRTIGPSLTSDPRLTSAGTSPVWAHTTYSKRGHFGHQDVKLERLKSMLSLVCLNWFSYISRTIQIVKYVDGRIGRYPLVPLNTIKHFTEEYCRL